jgi:hypothetical protein
MPLLQEFASLKFPTGVDAADPGTTLQEPLYYTLIIADVVRVERHPW